jgi:hypothetical protein
MQRALKKEKDLKQDDIATIVSSRTEEVRVMAEQEAEMKEAKKARQQERKRQSQLDGGGAEADDDGGGDGGVRLSQPGAAEDHENPAASRGNGFARGGGRGKRKRASRTGPRAADRPRRNGGKENEEEDWRPEDALDGGAPNADSHSDGEEESAPPRFAPKRRAEARQASAQRDTRAGRESLHRKRRRERETFDLCDSEDDDDDDDDFAAAMSSAAARSNRSRVVGGAAKRSRRRR